MTEHLNFMDAVKRMQELSDPREIMQDETMIQFIADVDEAGTDILLQKDQKYLSELVGFIQSIAVSELVMQGGIGYLSLLESPKFREVIAVVLKFSIGISALEELR